jgi:glutamyl-tRNA synthetase
MRTRFPPSPTGFLHVGGLRTALYNYLLARKNGGSFILRIEDTDQEREVPGAVEDIVESLTWGGVAPDEGVTRDGDIGDCGPYVQSQRLEIYQEHARILLEGGHAYRCFCTKERLDEMRKLQEARSLAPMYDRKCAALTKEGTDARAAAGEAHVLRLRVPRDRTMQLNDEIRGQLQFQGHTIDDQVLVKSDGFPTYHLANVVDDHLMRIDLVLRGEEWLPSLPKHVLLYEAFGWTPPRFAHIPLLLNPDRSKLSKRTGSVSVREYREKGYLPEALINFLALLGWNPGTEQEIFTIDELIAAFSLDRVQKAGAVFDLAKLDWLQGQWMRKMDPAEFAARALPLVKEKHPAAEHDKDFSAKCRLIQDRITFLHEAPDMLSFFYAEPTVDVALLANAKQKVTEEMLPDILRELEVMLGGLDTWTEEALLAAAKSTAEAKGWKLGQLLWPLRAALTGKPFSPGAVEVATALEKEKTMERLKKSATTAVSNTFNVWAPPGSRTSASPCDDANSKPS